MSSPLFGWTKLVFPTGKPVGQNVRRAQENNSSLLWGESETHMVEVAC